MVTVSRPDASAVAGSKQVADEEGRRRRRHRLVVGLTFVTGIADALGVLALGGAFSSVMTGNMVLLGLSAGTLDAQLAISSSSAIGAYIVGVLVGSRVAGVPDPSDPVWPRQVTWALSVELVAILGLLIFWEALLEDGFDDSTQLLMLMVLAAALGIQGSAVQRFGVPGLSSTYLTGTLTGLIAGVATRRPWPSLLPSAKLLVALIVGSCVGAAVIVHIPRLAPIVLVVPLAAVMIGGLSLRERRRD